MHRQPKQKLEYKYLMPQHMPLWDYAPCINDFVYYADVDWPHQTLEQVDWITGITEIETWLIQYTGPKYSRWTWATAREVYHVGVAFKYDRHRTLFLLQWA
jgi:hypothetical protein